MAHGQRGRVAFGVRGLGQRSAGAFEQLQGVSLLRSGERGAFQLFALDQTHLGRIGELTRKYADLPLDLADASLVVLAEELGSGRIFSTDTRDFRSYRWKNGRPFKNLLLS
jgi:predicted nucleic acid-binding protein